MNPLPLLQVICPHLDFSEYSLNELEGVLEAEVTRLAYAEEERDKLREYEEIAIQEGEKVIQQWQKEIELELQKINNKDIPDDEKFAEFQELLPMLEKRLDESDYAETLSQAMIVVELMGRLEIIDG